MYLKEKTFCALLPCSMYICNNVKMDFVFKSKVHIMDFASIPLL